MQSAVLGNYNLGTECNLFMRTKRPQHIAVPRNIREL